MAEKKTTTKKTPVAKKATKETKAVKTVGDVKPAKKTANLYVAQMGKRKNASASVRMIRKGSGLITVNGQPMEAYFDNAYQKKVVEQPVKQVGIKDVDFSILVKGGGKNGQADAARLAITKILVNENPELRPALKAKGWLKRDPRIKERKKPGLKRARRAPQWSKR